MAICGVAFAANSELSTNEIEFIDRVDTSLEHLYESRLEASYLVQFQDNQPTPMTADPLQDTKPLQIKATFQDFGAALDYRAVNLTDATAETVFRLMASSLGRKVKYVGVKPSQARATYTFDAIPLRALGVLASGVSGQVTCRVGQNVLAVFRRGDVRARDRKLCYL